MNAVKGVLREELDNSQRLLRRYQRALAALPRGALVEKEIKGRKFFYLARREGKKVVFAYKGRLPAPEIERFREAMKLRAKYRRLSAELRSQIRFLSRALHERRRRPARPMP